MPAPIAMRALGIAAVTALLALCALLPFLPGGYDQLAVPSSAMAQIVGTGGLLLVPFAAMQYVAERSPRLVRWRFAATVLTLVASVVVTALVAIAAVVHSGFVLGVVAVAGGALLVRRLLGILGGLRRHTPGPPSALPLYLTIVPLASALFQLAVVERATEFSRTTAMSNAAPVIAAIERNRAANGRYPASLLSAWQDYSPGIVGIERYYYEPHFEAYNLMFEQFSYRFGTREFVVYNPRDEQTITAHSADILEMTPEQLARERQTGHYEAQPAPVPHWKYFRFD